MEIYPEQSGLIESIPQCLEEAERSELWRPVGVYADGVLIGFAMYGRFEEPFAGERVWLDRFLIDKHFQGKGFGKAALSKLTERLFREYGTEEIYLSVYESNAAAIRLYRRQGFRFNGELDRNGEKVMVLEKRDGKEN